MPLFTDPVVLSDGTANHTFTFLAQLSDKRALAGEWTEPAAEASVESKLVSKQDRTSSTFRRRLLQRKANRTTITRGLRPITVNVTVAHDVEHTNAQITEEITIMRNALAASGVVANFIGGQI